MKKKLIGMIIVVLVAVSLAFTLAACGSSKKKQSAAGETKTEETTKDSKETTEEEEEEEEEEETTTKKNKKEKETKEDKEKEEETTADKDGFSVKAMEGKVFCIAEGGVNVRTGYSTDDPVLAVLQYGDEAELTGTVTKDGADYGWFRINYNGQTAYVSADFFDVRQHAGETPAENIDDSQFEQEAINQVLAVVGQDAEIVSTEMRQGIGEWFDEKYCYIGIINGAGNVEYYYATPQWVHSQAEVELMNEFDEEHKAQPYLPAVGEPADDFERICREMAVEKDGGDSVVISSELRHDGIGDWLQGDYYYIGVQNPDGEVTYYYCRTDWALTEEEIADR